MKPGNITLHIDMIFGLVLFKRKLTDQEVGPAGQRQPGARAGKRFLVLFQIFQQDQRFVTNSLKYFRSV